MITVNFVAVVAAAVVAFVLGFLFHGPIFGKLWMRLADIHPTGNEKLSDMLPQMGWNLVSNFFTALGLSVVYMFASTSTVAGGAGVWTGIHCAVLIWLCFLVASSSIEVVWMGRKTSLWLFESACSLIVMLAMGIIIAVM